MTPDRRRDLVDDIVYESVRALVAGSAGFFTLLFLCWLGTVNGWV